MIIIRYPINNNIIEQSLFDISENIKDEEWACISLRKRENEVRITGRIFTTSHSQIVVPSSVPNELGDLFVNFDVGPGYDIY